MSQLTEEQLHTLLQQQQAYMKNTNKNHSSVKRVRSANKRNNDSVTAHTLPSSRPSKNLKTASQIYSQIPAPFSSIGSGRRRAGHLKQSSTLQA